MEIASDVFKECEGIDSGKGVTLYKLTCCLPSLKQTVRIGFPVNSEQRFNSNLSLYSYSPACYCSKIANMYMYVLQMVFLFFKKVVLKCPSLMVIQGSAFPVFDWFRDKVS